MPIKPGLNTFSGAPGEEMRRIAELLDGGGDPGVLRLAGQHVDDDGTSPPTAGVDPRGACCSCQPEGTRQE